MFILKLSSIQKNIGINYLYGKLKFYKGIDFTN